MAGYTVQHSEHWVYDGSGLGDGDVFGAVEERPLIGHEWGATAFRSHDRTLVVTGGNGAPLDFAILGSAEPRGGKILGAVSAVLMGTYTSPAGGNGLHWVRHRLVAYPGG